MIIKILIDLACGALFAWGGYNFLPARRFIMPVLLAVMISASIYVWWAGILILPVMGTLCLGYDNFGKGNLARAIWLTIQAFVIALGLTILGHVSILFAILYVVIAGVLAGILNNRLKQIIGDLIFGCWLGIIIFLIH